MVSVKKKGILGDLKESLIQKAFQTSGLLAIMVLLGIFALLLYTSIPAFREISLKEFLTSTRWDPTSPERPEYGLLSMLASTVFVTLIALVIAFPVGVAVAAYLSDVASPRVREILKPIIELLAAIPSVVVGFIGLTLVSPLIAKIFNLNHGLTSLNGGLMLAVMALPTIISISEDSLNAVPGFVCRSFSGPRGQPLANPGQGKNPGGHLRNNRLYDAGHGPGHRRNHDRVDGYRQRQGLPPWPPAIGQNLNRQHRHRTGRGSVFYNPLLCPVRHRPGPVHHDLCHQRDGRRHPGKQKRKLQ